MSMSECATMKVDVPVGYLLNQAREILVSIDRVDEAPLSIRLRLIPAETSDAVDIGATPPRSPDDTHFPIRRLSQTPSADGYPDHDYGGGD